jgi:hypothetical protein
MTLKIPTIHLRSPLMTRYYYKVKLLDNSIKYITDQDFKDLGFIAFKDMQRIEVIRGVA